MTVLIRKSRRDFPLSIRRKSYMPVRHLTPRQQIEQRAIWGQEKSLQRFGGYQFELLAEVQICRRVHLVYRDRFGAVWLAHLSNPFVLGQGSYSKRTEYDVWTLCFGPVRPDTQIDRTNTTTTTTPYITAALPFITKAFA